MSNDQTPNGQGDCGLRIAYLKTRRVTKRYNVKKLHRTEDKSNDQGPNIPMAKEASFWSGFFPEIRQHFTMPEKKIDDLPREMRMLYTKGYEAFQRENYDYAIELFNQILIKEPANVDVRQALRAAQSGKSGAKKGFFSRALSGASSSPQVAKAQLALRSNPQQAILIAEQILASDANNASAHKIVAEAALALEMPKTAVMSLEILHRNSPDDKDTAFQLADALVAAGEKTKAENVLVALRGSHPNAGEINQKLKDISARKSLDEGGYGALASGKGSYRDVLKDKDETIKLEQQNRQVKSGDTGDELLKDYESRIAKEPNNLKLLRNMAEIYVQKNDFDKGIFYYEKMAVVDGGNDSALQRTIAETKIKRFNQQLAQLDASAPDYSEKAAQVTAERDAFQLEECKARAEKYPTDLLIRFELGVLYFKAGKIGEAMPELQKAKNNPSKRLPAMSYLAQCLAKRNMNDMAASTVQEALKEKPAFDAEKMELTYLLGTLFEKMGKKEEAIEQFKLIYQVDMAYKDVAKKVDDYYNSQG
jgi:tetratricopeptide (TPR) repeat protein